MPMKKKSVHQPEPLDAELVSRLSLAAIPQLGPDFTHQVLTRLRETAAPPLSIWNSLIRFSRPMLVSATVIALVILLLHLVLIDTTRADIYELTDLSFDVMVADVTR